MGEEQEGERATRGGGTLPSPGAGSWGRPPSWGEAGGKHPPPPCPGRLHAAELTNSKGAELQLFTEEEGLKSRSTERGRGRC